MYVLSINLSIKMHNVVGNSSIDVWLDDLRRIKRHMQTLKRTGWVNHGVHLPESVAGSSVVMDLCIPNHASATDDIG